MKTPSLYCHDDRKCFAKQDGKCRILNNTDKVPCPFQKVNINDRHKKVQARDQRGRTERDSEAVVPSLWKDPVDTGR
ncbi:MAG TPA: hypothetical protein DHV42_03030 [Lachnospiraceae bacterium]|nr:hypothetical protein [Lachnospiraceae bacterium]